MLALLPAWLADAMRESMHCVGAAACSQRCPDLQCADGLPKLMCSGKRVSGGHYEVRSKTVWSIPKNADAVTHAQWRLDTITGIINEGACAQVAVFDQKWYVQFTAILNIVRMVFICLVLALGVYMINQDAVRLVLRPIERMLRKVGRAT